MFTPEHTPNKSFEKLIEIAALLCLDRWRNERHRPGSLLDRLTPEEREEIKKLTPDMIKNYRITR